MAFSEAIGKLKIFTHHITKALNDISWVFVTLKFYRKKSSKIPFWLQINRQLQSNCKLFQQIITVFMICHTCFNNSNHCIMSDEIYYENTLEQKHDSVCQQLVFFTSEKEIKIHFKHDFPDVKFLLSI